MWRLIIFNRLMEGNRAACILVFNAWYSFFKQPLRFKWRGYLYMWRCLNSLTESPIDEGIRRRVVFQPLPGCNLRHTCREIRRATNGYAGMSRHATRHGLNCTLSQAPATRPLRQILA